MLTEKDVKLRTFYGEDATRPRLAALSWEDGPEGVAYKVEGMDIIFPLFCSKKEFLRKVNSRL